MRKDIQTEEDIELLIRSFYEKVLVDDTISFFFTDIAKIDLEAHLPTLFQFWGNILLGPNGYQKNVMKIHMDLNQKAKMEPQHFEQWVSLFQETVDELFEGKTANMAKNRAYSIAVAMQTKIYNSNL